MSTWRLTGLRGEAVNAAWRLTGLRGTAALTTSAWRLTGLRGTAAVSAGAVLAAPTDAEPGDTITLDPTGSVGDVSIAQIGGPSVVLSGVGPWTFTAPTLDDGATLTFRCIADNGGPTDHVDVTINVWPVNEYQLTGSEWVPRVLHLL